jgi:hydrogenase maturation protein HypF
MIGPSAPAQVEGEQIRVRGRVHGVGFRYNALRLARECGLSGDVCNDRDGVLIHAWGARAALDALARRIVAEAPSLARIDSLERRPLPAPAPAGPFRIAPDAV